MATEFHAVGVAYRSGKNKGFVVTRFVVSGDRILNAELVSPEPEAIHFAAQRLKAEAGRLMNEARGQAEVANAFP